jgi:hypothetical protein
MIVLDGNTESLEIQTSAAVSLDWSACWNRLAGAAYEQADAADGNISSATTTSVIPGVASKQIQIKEVSVYNRGATANTVTVKKDVSGVDRFLFSASLLGGESIQYVDGQGFRVLDRGGRVKEAATQDTGYTGKALAFYKVGTAVEAAGQWYSWAKDSGNPGAWAPGTPGLAGRATDGTLTADNGCLLIRNPASGANYLTALEGVASVACRPNLFDVLWVNSGAVVTTTTAQTVNSVAFPARDIGGTANGEGCWVGILVATATTNAGAITNTTLSYTNSSGTAGRTATVASYPATAVIGTVVWFLLAAGDTGVQSIQSVTLGTSYGGGAISLILARPLATFAVPVANIGAPTVPAKNPGVRLYDGTCALPIGLMTATTATTLTAVATVMER